MKVTSNYDRARDLVNHWPAWKKDFQLTKNSVQEQKKQQDVNKSNPQNRKKSELVK
jgi:hypothetical protein